MTRPIDHAQLLAREELVASPAERACSEQSFEMPTAVFGAMAAFFFGFMAILAVGLASPGLVVPMGVNFAFLAAFFAVPAIFGGVKVQDAPAPRLIKFLRQGIETATGHSSGNEAVTLVLILPALIFFWAVAIVIIVALV